MQTRVSEIEIARTSQIALELPGAYFHDCYRVSLNAEGLTAMALYLRIVSATPAWVDVLMALRNRAVALVGLKNLGALGGFDKAKPASSYRVGDRVGIFTLLLLTENEIILGDSDKHLNVKVSLYKHAQTQSVAVATVVHVHNLLGRVYMLLVAPMHRLIAPAMLAQAK
jgi:hypothetical protein